MPPVVYHPGEAVSTSGLYKVVHHRIYRAPIGPAEDMSRFVSGEIFPDCIACADKVDYLLITGAPHIFGDPDFASML